MLHPEQHIPHILAGEVRGADGSVAWGMTHPGIPTADLWAQDADRRNMARVVLTRSACERLILLLQAMRDTLPG